MKKCSRCKKTKQISEFQYRKEATDNLQSQCRVCRYEVTTNWKRSKNGVVAVIYSNQITHSKSRGHRKPEYTKTELGEWLFSQQKFHELYSEWVNSGHKKRLSPSVDRKHDDIHYCMSNVQLMSWEDNNKKINVGTFRKGHKGVGNGKSK